MRKPQVIGLLKQKGGTGATTIAVHLALAATEGGRRVCIVDTDPQHSALTWADARGSDYPPVVPAEEHRIRDAVRAAAQDGYDLVLIDTPPHSTSMTAAAARESAIALIPTRPSAFDLAALPSTVEIIRATRARGLIVLSACPPRAKEVAEARDMLESFGVPVWEGSIGERTAFRRAVASGQTVTEADPAGKGASEIRDLWRYLARLLAH